MTQLRFTNPGSLPFSMNCIIRAQRRLITKFHSNGRQPLKLFALHFIRAAILPITGKATP